jgi:hypothetical protein
MKLKISLKGSHFELHEDIQSDVMTVLKGLQKIISSNVSKRDRDSEVLVHVSSQKVSVY